MWNLLNIYEAIKVIIIVLYAKAMPSLKSIYIYIIEFHNKNTHKRHVLSWDSLFTQEELVNQFLTYELLFSKEDSKSSMQSGLVFITHWVLKYLTAR